jgi:ribokinase
MFGSEAAGLFTSENIDTRYIIKDPDNPSGVALITVDENGENSIVVAPGSNSKLTAYDIDEEVFETKPMDIFVMQLEIPVGTVEFIAQKTSAKGNRVILNPAPARQLSDELLSCLYLITPNETEAEQISGVRVNDLSTAEKAATIIRKKGVKNVIITMGASGAYLQSDGVSKIIQVVPVRAIDTTAAGDVFNGAIAVALSEGMDLENAVEFANKAASISVTRMGAQASAPYRKELLL